ncbi:MAG TPA: multiheme c-type cytochrome, partial [Ramlibacter sp.]|nr:multiheme c-type cytochrome [Ramlibacter sp.]
MRGMIAGAALTVLGAVLGLAAPAAAQAPAQNPAQVALPSQAADVHLGVASCAGSTCHGAVEPWRDSNVLQNEYTTWQSKDSHAKAYEVLLSAESKRIAKNLGLPNAHEAKVCLDCHADNVAPEKRGQQFQISDGVGCEACHGGGERWLGIHVSGRGTHAQNVAAGMFPTEDPVKRAELCLGCHFGDETRFVTHRIMGAGHPRMSFELDTFTAIQPAHYRIDDDYAKRKTVASGVKTWAIGQAIAYRKLMTAVADPKRNHDGIFPEFVLYDCQACHTPLTNVSWAPRETEGIGPGVVRIHDANTMMLRVLARHVNPALEKEL